MENNKALKVASTTLPSLPINYIPKHGINNAHRKEYFGRFDTALLSRVEIAKLKKGL